MLLAPDRSLLLVVHLQARLVPAVAEAEPVTRRVATLIKAALRLDVPVLAMELNREGLGPTVPEVASLLPPDSLLHGMKFSCAREPELIERLLQLGRDHIALCGLEAHVCVLQTAFGLAEKGYHVAVVADAISSRAKRDYDAAIARFGQRGLTVATAEMVVFEWLQSAGNAAFKDVLALIK